MRRLLLLTALLALAAVPAAAAKEPVRATVCGASGCKTSTDRTRLARVPWGGSDVPAAPRPAPYYRIRLKIDFGATVKLIWVPSRSVFYRELEGNAPGWSSVVQGKNALAWLVRGVRPFPAPKTWATVL
jgi:hypothetical protein